MIMKKMMIILPNPVIMDACMRLSFIKNCLTLLGPSNNGMPIIIHILPDSMMVIIIVI